MAARGSASDNTAANRPGIASPAHTASLGFPFITCILHIADLVLLRVSDEPVSYRPGLVPAHVKPHFGRTARGSRQRPECRPHVLLGSGDAGVLGGGGLVPAPDTAAGGEGGG